MVAISWATFISGPFSPPSASFRSAAWPLVERATEQPRAGDPRRLHAHGSADLGVAAHARAEVFSLSYLGSRVACHDGSGMAASSWSISPSSRPSPLAQKPGSDASSPKGASSSRWRMVPPARSSSR